MIQLLMPTQKTPNRKKSPKVSWFERTMAIVALLDFSLVLFDLSYIPGRDFYFKEVPAITQVYDSYKGIIPHRETNKYLKTVNSLEDKIKEKGTNSPELDLLLAQLRSDSLEMINENPFADSNKNGTLEKIKNRLRKHIYNPENSAKKSFVIFWSREYLNNNGWAKEINWFDRKIKPLIASNYYRGFGENGEPIDNFWQLDCWFIMIFGLDFLGRTFWLGGRYSKWKWRDAMLSRWYDIFLLIPTCQILRIIPVTVRLNDAKFPDLEPVRKEFSRIFIGGFAQELTEVIVIQIINQIQGAIKSGELTKQLFQSKPKQYLDINGVNEIETIAAHLVQVTVYKVLPKLQPDLEALLLYSIESMFKQSSVYQGLQQVPGLGNLPEQMATQLVSELSKLATFGPQNAYEAFKSAANDTMGNQLSSQLVQHFVKVLGVELQKQQTLPEIQLLLSDFLEEVKINYVRHLSEEDFYHILAESKKLEKTANS
jgi:hypothetical protein